jgi:photosystem II stability/assembly factor-like uncharacterized protein
MLELKERFNTLDQVAAPDLARTIELRARHLSAVPGAAGADPGERHRPRSWLRPRQLMAAVAIMILGLAVAVILEQARSNAPVRHHPTPSPRLAPGAAVAGLGPGMHMSSPKVGWAAISRNPGRILRTADGGAHWIDVTPVQGLVDRFVDPVFLDESNAWLLSTPPNRVAAGPSGRQSIANDGSGQADIWHTQDGGRSWQRIANLRLALWYSGQKRALQLQFVDRLHGWLVVYLDPGGMVIYRTSDTGIHWDEISVPDGNSGHSTGNAIPSDCLGAMRFTSERDGWIGAGCSRSDRLFATQDGGATWSERPLPRRVADYTPGSEWHFEGGISAARGGVLLYTILGPADATGLDRELYSSADGGGSWVESPLPAGRYAPGLPGSLSLPPTFVGEQGWIAIDGVLYVTRNAGGTWQKAGTPFTGLDNGTNLEFLDARTGFALMGTSGGKWVLLQTADGGRTWTRQWTE